MTEYEFIFSGKPVKRLYRHVLFWAVLALHFIIQNLLIGGFNEGLKQRSFEQSAYYLLFFLPIYIVATYILLYILIPVYFLRRKYALFLSWIAALVAISCITCALSGALYMHTVWHLPFSAITFNSDKYNVVVNGLLKLQRTGILNKEKMNALLRKKLPGNYSFLKINSTRAFFFIRFEP
jgi:signal transduction histidine kinase